MMVRRQSPGVFLDKDTTPAITRLLSNVTPSTLSATLSFKSFFPLLTLAADLIAYRTGVYHI
ncbi:hypothetical protein IJJ08_05220 [bacterium]|nr:hypothetical protein [bacterium]